MGHTPFSSLIYESRSLLLLSGAHFLGCLRHVASDAASEKPLLLIKSSSFPSPLASISLPSLISTFFFFLFVEMMV